MPRALLRRLASALGIRPRLGPELGWADVEAAARAYLLLRDGGCRARAMEPLGQLVGQWSAPQWLLVRAALATILDDAPDVIVAVRLDLEADELARQASAASLASMRRGRRDGGRELWRQADRLRQEAARLRRSADYARQMTAASERLSIAARDDWMIARLLGRGYGERA